MKELRYIPGYEGLYKVDEDGNIFSEYTKKYLRPSVSQAGYKQYVLHKDKKQYIMPAHRAVALAFIPMPEPGLVVNHKDENKMNNNVDNLEWVTIGYNTNYNGNRAAQKIRATKSKRFYVYDGAMNFLFSFVGIRHYASLANLSDGNLSSLINYNSQDGVRPRKYRGFIYSFIPPTQLISPVSSEVRAGYVI